MPSKRRFIIFLIVLTVMLLIKYLHGEVSPGEAAVGWDPHSCWDCGPDLTLEGTVTATMFSGLVFGTLAGLLRARKREQAAREGRCFTSDMVCLNLSE